MSIDLQESRSGSGWRRRTRRATRSPVGAAGPARFELTVTARVGSTFVSHVAQHVRAARRCIRAPLRELSVVLVSDATIRDLHRRFMNEPDTTDVLTFPLEMDERGRATGGEVYVCVPAARRAAREHRTRVADELLLYALHGMLHLCGFDDRTPAQYQRMHRAEDRLLARLGVGEVFRPAPRRARAAAGTDQPKGRRA